MISDTTELAPRTKAQRCHGNSHLGGGYVVLQVFDRVLDLARGAAALADELFNSGLAYAD